MFRLVIWKDVLKQLSRNKRQSFLTLIAVSVAVFVVLVILSSSAYTTNQLATDLEVDNSKSITLSYKSTDSNSVSGFTDEDETLVKDLLKTVSIKRQSTHYDVSAETRYQRTHQQLEFRSLNDLEEQATIIPNVIAGKELDAIQDADEVAISDDAAKALSRSEDVEKILNQVVEIKGNSFKVVSVYYASSLRNFLPQLIVTTKGKQYLLENKDYFDQMILQTRDFNLVQKALSALDESGTNREKGSYTYIDNVKLYEDNKAQVQTVLTFIALLSGISIFVSGFGVMNAMLSSVSERSQEIAIRRALGAKKKDIQDAYLIEGTALATLGGLLGLMLTALFMLLMNAIGLTASLSGIQILVTLLSTITCGALFSLLPSVVASRKNVVEGLK